MNLHPAYRERLENFRKAQLLIDEEALAGYIAKLGIQAVARHANIPETELESFMGHHQQARDLVCQFTPQLFSTGLQRTDASPNLKDIKELKLKQGSFPDQFEIPVRGVTDDTDQGSIGSCVGWAGAHGSEVVVAQALNQPDFRANPSFPYGKIKERSGSKKHGSNLYDLAEVLQEDGVAAWDSMPVHRRAPKDNPGNLPLPREAEEDAAQRKIKDVYWWNPMDNHWRPEDVKAVLYGAFERYPVRPLPIIIGADLFESFFNPHVARTGYVPMPLGEYIDKCIGGHAMVIVGWHYRNGVFYLKVKNSWGPEFGDKGFLYFPFQYVNKYFHSAIVCHNLVGEEVATPEPAVRSSSRATPAFALLAALIAVLAFLFVGFPHFQGISVKNNESEPLGRANESINPAMKSPTISPTYSEGDLQSKDSIEIYLQILQTIEEAQARAS